MVRTALGQEWQPEERPERPDRRYDLALCWELHERYWGHEASATRARFALLASSKAAKREGVITLEKAFHISDGFRIVCDGQIDGQDCGNVIGYAPLPAGHDGLCERCRRVGADFPPRITDTPDGLVLRALLGGREVLPRPWQYPPNPGGDVPPPPEA